jgi:RimJ/RimL family protein N-acetyltransferase
MNFIDVYSDPTAPTFLYMLLRERTPQQSISHKRMPSIEEHLAFIESNPYPHWFLIEVDDDVVGSVYLTSNREIGIFILPKFHGRGIGKAVIDRMRRDYPGKLLANVNPENAVSRKMFEGLGAKLIQVTYEL